MSVFSRWLAFFPVFWMVLAGGLFVQMCLVDSWAIAAGCLGLGLFVMYGLPVLLYRVHHRFFPVTEGISYLQGKAYSPWWGSHQLQLVYIAFPVLETVLRLIPGAFSLWLRLWGAQVGRGVYWGPGLEIADRGLLTVGDRAIIGHRVGLYAHVIKPKRQDLMLYVKRIHIGSDSFIGSASRLGPGVEIESGKMLPVNSDLFPNQSGAAYLQQNTHVEPGTCTE